jgi:hypothetical protein
MGRPSVEIILLIGVLAVGCGTPASEAPVGGLIVVGVAGGGPDNAPLGLTVTLEAQGRVEAEARVLVGFPHWYYGMRGTTGLAEVRAEAGGTSLPTRHRRGEHGRWYAEATLDRELDSGTRMTITVTGASPVGVPGELQLLVLFDPHGGDEPRLLRQVPPLLITPSKRSAARGSRTVHKTRSARRVIFADLHGHSALSDGRGSPRGYFAFARERGRVQVAALTDHDWQLEPPEFREMVDAADAANVPGQFIALAGIETNIQGHEVALFFDPAPVRDLLKLGAAGGAFTIWEETDFGATGAQFAPRPRQLLQRLRKSVVTASHTTLARGMGTAHPRVGRLPAQACIEMYSAHGSSECPNCPRAVSSEGSDEDGPVSDVRAHLDSNPTLCLLGTGDSHDGRPGDTRWGPFTGGLTGMEVEELTREGVLDALRTGRTWATTGERSILELDEGGGQLRIQSPTPVAEVVFVTEGTEQVLVRGDRRGPWIEVPTARRGGYVRVRFQDGAMAWINPRRP